MTDKQQIKCNVKDCIHNDEATRSCRLESICIDHTYDDEEAYEKEDTVCNDFECKCDHDFECDCD